ncbi:hydrolase [Yeosuana aromativorans]|uniref:Hydrolase n=2 Tax=Yeosuana aromativorans TaxID=288019 RepID=A0A8J3BPP2_9FLAO|nr:hydrolase [Yeosuana aromativorans]
MSVIKKEKIKYTGSISTVFYDASKFEIIGQLPNTETYDRLPLISKNKVRKPVWALSENSAGISIRFSSNTSSIKIRWKLKNNINAPNMTPIVSKGLDLYAYTDNKWQFVGVAKPEDTFQNEAIVIEGMDTINREYLLNLPLYDGIKSLEIGIDKGASINKPSKEIIDTSHPIVFYGTSITQGASASRPGLTYPALLERHFNKEVINLGFSGNGRFEKEIAEYIMTANPSVIILDCTPNSPADTIIKNLPKTIDYINSINDTVPIILVESIMRDFAFFKKDDKTVFGTMSSINEQNNALNEVYERRKMTRKNIFYINSENLIGKDHEATIDGTHFNDLGHYRAYKFLRDKIKKIISP